MSTLAGLSLRLGRDDDDDAARFCALSNSLYARKVDPRYYAWQFFQPPHAAVAAMAVDSLGEMAGGLALHLRELQPEGPATAWLLDIMVRPSQQRQGVFRAVSDFALERLPGARPAALCVMANANADAATARLGWTRVNAFETCVRSTAAAGAALRKDELSFSRIQSFDTCATLCADGQTGDGPGRLRTDRSPAFLDWRFLRNPRYHYEAFHASLRGEPFGYLVLKVFQDPGSGQAWGDIVELRWRDDDGDALAGMLSFALDHFRERGVAQAATWLQTNTLLDDVGRELGFQPEGSPRFFCVKPLRDDAAALLDPRRWSLTMADSEVY